MRGTCGVATLLLLAGCVTAGPSGGSVTLADLVPRGGCPNCGWDSARGFGVQMVGHYCCCSGPRDCVTVPCGQPCLARAPELEVEIRGAAAVRAGDRCGWAASVTGVSPWTVQWSIDGRVVGTDPRYAGETGGSDFVLTVLVTDALERSVRQELAVAVDENAEACGSPPTAKSVAVDPTPVLAPCAAPAKALPEGAPYGGISPSGR